MAENGRLEPEGHQRDDQRFDEQEQRQNAGELSDIQRGPRHRRQQQRPQCLVLAFAVENTRQRQRAGKRNGDPQDRRGGGAVGAALLHESEGKYQHAENREER